MSEILINTRNLGASLSGVQRYTQALLQHWQGDVERIAPSAPMQGLKGHAWEQCILPGRLRGRLLFSPSNTGPLAVARQVVTIHDIAALEHPEWFSPKFAAWYRWLTPRLCKRVRRVLVVSEHTRQRLLALAGGSSATAAKVDVIYPGVDPRFSPQARAQSDSLVAELGLPSADYLLCLGSLEPRKNLKRLLAAWRQALPDLPEHLWLVLAGGQGARQVFQDADTGALPPRVHATGFVADHHLPALYAGAMGFAYVSVYEGFGLPPLEAMAAGTPVLVGDNTSLPEVIGDAGLLVDAEEVDAIAQGLLRLATDAPLRDALRERGLAQAARFTWETCAARTWQALSEAA